MLRKRNVLLTEPGHRYIDENDDIYTSVTTAIGAFAPKFNKDYWTIYKALQRSGYKVKPDVGRWQYITVDNIQLRLTDLLKGQVPLEVTSTHIEHEWAIISKIACDKGNKVHNQIEDGTNAITDLKDGKKDAKAFVNFYQMAKQYQEVYSKVKEDLDDGWRVYPEMVTYLNIEEQEDLGELRLAGMIDHPLFKERKFKIKDWKTNKNELRHDAGYYKKDQDGNVTNLWIATNETMLWPLNHLPNSNGTKYSLQLSLYARTLELRGYELETDGLELCHIRGDFDEHGVFQKQSIEWHPIPYLKDEADAIIYWMRRPEEELKENRNQLIF